MICQAPRLIEMPDLFADTSGLADVAHRDRKIDDAVTHSLLEILSGWDCSGPNPLCSPRWTALIGGEDQVLQGYGYLTAEIYRRPQRLYGGNTEFLFARGIKDGTEYYVSRRATNMSFDEFDQLRVGDMLSIQPADDGDDDKTWPVRDAFLIG